MCSGWMNFVLQITDFWPDMERWVDTYMEETRDLVSIKI